MFRIADEPLSGQVDNEVETFQGNLPDEAGFERLLAQPPARALYQDLITEVNRGLARFEQIKKFAELFPGKASLLQKRNRRFVIDAS